MGRSDSITRKHADYELQFPMNKVTAEEAVHLMDEIIEALNTAAVSSRA